MPYLGNVPAEAYTNTVKDSFNGDASTTAFTLSQPSTTNNLRVVVENVIQDPTVAYTVSGTTLTFTSAPPVGTANIYAVHLGPATQTAVPPSEITSATNFTDGITVDKDGGTVITADRASSDGTIIDLQKDGASVGAIASVNGASIIAYGDTGIRFGGDGYLPVDSSGSLTDNTVDFGNGSWRYKDLYLSGGVYLGGTGSANLLDQYEEGTFTYTLNCSTSGSYTVRTGYATGFYTKVGRIVTINLRYESQGSSSPSGNVQLGNLPFVFISSITSGSPGFGAPILIRGANNNGDFSSAFLSFQPGGTYATFYKQLENGTFAAISNNDIASAIEGYACFTYVTSA